MKLGGKEKRRQVNYKDAGYTWERLPVCYQLTQYQCVKNPLWWDVLMYMSLAISCSVLFRVSLVLLRWSLWGLQYSVLGGWNALILFYSVSDITNVHDIRTQNKDNVVSNLNRCYAVFDLCRVGIPWLLPCKDKQYHFFERMTDGCFFCQYMISGSSLLRQNLIQQWGQHEVCQHIFVPSPCQKKTH